MTSTFTKRIERETRPWGEYFVIDQGECFKVKRITVYPGGRLSLQYHNLPLRVLDNCFWNRFCKNR